LVSWAGFAPVKELLSGTGPPAFSRGCTWPRPTAAATRGALRRLEKSAVAFVAAGAAGVDFDGAVVGAPRAGGTLLSTETVEVLPPEIAGAFAVADGFANGGVTDWATGCASGAAVPTEVLLVC